MATTETLWMVNTRTCNLSCAYCYQGSHNWTWQDKRGLKKMMDYDVVERALPWVLQWAQRGLQIVWYGGEPLLNKPLIRRTMPIWRDAFKAAGKELRWSVTTNGTMLDAETRALLDEFDVGLLLSLDGPPELHNMSRPFYGGKPSFETIPTEDIVKWRPNLEIVWQLDPRWKATPAHFEDMISRGFHKINFNVNWLMEWSGDRRVELMEFMRHVERSVIQSRRGKRPGREVECNWAQKFDELLLKTAAGTGKMEQPCGTGLHMLALTPEGWLYPSQEMAFTTLEPNRAPGTAEHYKVGNVWNEPVVDRERLDDISSIRTEQMVKPPGFDCNNCVANPISIGGCHCRYVGSDGVDPSNRFNVLPGYCQSMQSAVTGLLQGATIEGYVRLKFEKKPEVKPAAPVVVERPLPENREVMVF